MTKPAFIPPAQQTNVLSIIALVLGFVVPIGGVVVGIIALRQLKRRPESGRGLAVAGIIVGAALTLLTALPLLLSAPELIQVFWRR
jgi:Na+/proline symporter